MTTQECIDLYKVYVSYDNDSMHGEDPSNTDIVRALNEAQRTISERVYMFDPAITFTLTADQTTYNVRDLNVVSRKVIEAQAVYINNNPLRVPTSNYVGLMGYSGFEEMYPYWRKAASGTPIYAIDQGIGKVQLYPAPTSSVVAQSNHYISGVYYAADLSASSLSASSQLPEEIHEAMVRLAVINTTLPNMTESYQFQKIQALAQADNVRIDDLGRANKRKINKSNPTSFDRSVMGMRGYI